MLDCPGFLPIPFPEKEIPITIPPPPMINFQILVLPALVIALSAASLRADEYPEAKATQDPNVVVSPFPPNKKINITGFLPGDLARDPHTNQIFRIPARKATPLVFKPEIIEDDPSPPLPPVSDPDSLPILRPEIVEEPDPDAPSPPFDPSDPPASIPTQIPVTTSPQSPETTSPDGPIPDPIPEAVIATRAPREIDGSLEDFINLFVRSGQADDPTAQAEFFANEVTSYFGIQETSKEQVLIERQAHIAQWPRRIYVISGKPRFVNWISPEGAYDEFAIDVRIYQSLKNISGDTKRGYADHRLNVREKPDGSFEITAAEEHRARSVLIDP